VCSLYWEGDTYNLNLYFPIDAIKSIESYSEISKLFASPEKANNSEVTNKGELFLELMKTLKKARKSLSGKPIYDPRITDGVEPWDYNNPKVMSLSEFRMLALAVRAEYAIVCSDNEIDEPEYVDVRDFIFTGYYMGVTGFPGKKGSYKPHFAFELYESHDLDELGDFEERIMPIVLVPVSDKVELDISPGQS